MSLDPLLPVAPARVKALLLPLGRLKADRFASFADRLRAEHVVHLRDISADGRPNRSESLTFPPPSVAPIAQLTLHPKDMFSPLAYPDGAILYDLITHVPPASHLALSPFDLYREPLAVVAVADGTELRDASFSKRHSASGAATTITEKNIRALYQELEDVRDAYPKALVHRAIVFDYVHPSDTDIPMPKGLMTVPPVQDCKRTTIKTVMCDISSILLAEMTTLAKYFEAMAAIESPSHPSNSAHINGGAFATDGAPENGFSRRNSSSLSRSTARARAPPPAWKVLAIVDYPCRWHPGRHSARAAQRRRALRRQSKLGFQASP